MLGQEVCVLLQRKGLDYIGTDRELDFTSLNEVEGFCTSKKPQWIINCAAYTAVDKAESEPEQAASLNVTGLYNLAVIDSKIGARLINISTDYVFGGHGLDRPLREEDEVFPESVYGRTKLDGETSVWDNLAKHFIIRIAWLYGRYGKNFVSTMLSLMRKKPEIKVVNDQWGSPTWAFDVTELFVKLIESDSREYGTYHFSGEGAITWYDFAVEIKSQAIQLGMRNDSCEVNPCSTEEFPTAAKRPAWRVYFPKRRSNRI